MDVMIVTIVALAAIAIGVGLGYTLKRKSGSDQRLLAEESAAEIRANADAERKAILLGAKEEAIRALAAAEDEARALRVEVQAQERRQRQKEENLDRKIDEIENHQRKLQHREEETEARLHEVERLRLQQVSAIEEVAALTRDEARLLLLARVEEEVHTEVHGDRRVRPVESLERGRDVHQRGLPEEAELHAAVLPSHDDLLDTQCLEEPGRADHAAARLRLLALVELASQPEGLLASRRPRRELPEQGL